MAEETTGARADEFKGEGSVANALRYGAGLIDTKLAAGKITSVTANLMMGNLKACEASDEPDEQKLINISQVIGLIASA